jgi:phage I-like protein
MDNFSKWVLGIVGGLSTAGIIAAVAVLFAIQTQLAVLSTKMDTMERQQTMYMLKSEGDMMRSDVRRLEDRVDKLDRK